MTMTKPPWAAWFDGREAIQTLPPLCVKQCSASGSVDDAVDRWVRTLQFDAPPWHLRRYLADFGCWDNKELCDHYGNLRRLLWTWACNIQEEGEDQAFIYLDA
jgi:hypothetical protein